MSRINTNVSSLVAQNALARSNEDLQTSLSRLSTGLRINSGSDDPAGLIASETLRRDITSVEKAIINSERAGQLIATTDARSNRTQFRYDSVGRRTEIIYADDGSEDDSVRIAETFATQNVKIVRFPHLGVVEARNRADGPHDRVRRNQGLRRTGREQGPFQ